MRRQCVNARPDKGPIDGKTISRINYMSLTLWACHASHELHLERHQVGVRVVIHPEIRIQVIQLEST
jgi:hypothetical protein